MDKKEAMNLLKNERVSDWNMFREQDPEWIPELENESIRGDLRGINLADAKLANAKLWSANLQRSNLRNADLQRAELRYVAQYKEYYETDLADADLSGANLRGAQMPHEILCYQDAKLDGAVYDGLTDSGPVVLSEFGATIKPREKPPAYPSVFISYAWANKHVILGIDQWLRNMNLATKMDERDFFAGARIREEIARVMVECEVILIFHSAQSRDKPWTEFEREFAADLAMERKKQNMPPPRIIYIVIDDTPLPDISTKNRIAIMAKGKNFELVCQEIYHAILQIPRKAQDIDLTQFKDYVFR